MTALLAFRTFLLVSALAAAPLQAQIAPEPEGASAPTVQPPQLADGPLDADPDAIEEPEEIVVQGRRVARGSVIGDIEPEVVLDAAAVRAYGASNIGELLEEIAPLTGSLQGREGGGQPVVLLSGRRISGFREIRDLPPEAIARVDILPEEVALTYGYRADQKVVNIVLRRRFEAITVEAETMLATAGGRQLHEGDLTYLRLGNGSRLSLDGEYERRNPLFETERDLLDPDPDRTLLAAVDAVKLNATYNRTVLGNISATATGEYELTDSLSAIGRADDGSRRLDRDSLTRSANLGYALNGDVETWQWAVTGGYSRNTSNTRTDRSLDVDTARSIESLIETDATASGSLGPVATTLRMGFDLRDFDSETNRAGLVTTAALARDEVAAAISLDLPLLDESSAIGALSLNANGELQELSDFGTLRTIGTGVNWRPFDGVRLIGSVIREDGAPTVQQLGNPVLVTPNVRVFDFQAGDTVEITRISGGNPFLLADDRRVLKLALTVRPIDDTDLTLLANLTDTRITNPTANLPAATPEIEAAFPERFVRDAEGDLISIDATPVNFARRQTRQLRWGFNWSEVLEGPPPVGPDGQPLTPEQIEARRAERRAAFGARGQGGPGAGPGARERGGGGGFGGGTGFGGGGFGGGRNGRVQLSAFHTVSFEDSILIRPGVPELDLLDGSALGEGGGEPRHRVEVRAGYNRSGLGARLDVDWQGPSRLRAGPTSATGDLDFGSLTTLDLRVFADLGQQRSLVTAVPFFRGSRLTLDVDNIFDERIDVRDTAGLVPISYQPDLLDPLGRTVRLSFRKLF